MHKDELPASGEHEIRLSWEVGAMEPEPVAHLVHQPPHNDFGLRILASNRSHIHAAGELLILRLAPHLVPRPR